MSVFYNSIVTILLDCKTMITLLSPTKTQSTHVVKNDLLKSEPTALQKTNYLMSFLRKLSVDELSQLMKTSHTISKKTKDMIDAWDTSGNQTLSICLFQGDAFQKLDTESLSDDELLFSQNHLIILSALYGYLRPFDAVKEYRLDMKDPLVIPNYRNLYDYWKETVTSGLNKLLLEHKNQIILNLSSNEYFDVIDRKKLTGKVINVEFKVKKDNDYKTIGIYAKRGRGLLARHIIKNKIDSIEEIIDFNTEGFQFSKKFSTNDNYVFILG